MGEGGFVPDSSRKGEKAMQLHYKTLDSIESRVSLTVTCYFLYTIILTFEISVVCRD